MTIQDKCRSLRDRAAKLKEIRETADEVAALSRLLQQSIELRERLESAAEKAVLLRDHDIEIKLSDVEEIAPLNPLEKIIEQFSDKPEAASLTKRKYWTKLQDQGEAWRSGLDSHALRTWKKFVDEECLAGETPERLNSLLAKTKSNKVALEKYESIYRDLKSLRDEFPDSGLTVKRARDLSEKLQRAGTAFDFDVPEDVKNFLEAINQGGAEIALLTEEVLSWLHENNSESQYRIVGQSA